MAQEQTGPRGDVWEAGFSPADLEAATAEDGVQLDMQYRACGAQGEQSRLSVP